MARELGYTGAVSRGAVVPLPGIFGENARPKGAGPVLRKAGEMHTLSLLAREAAKEQIGTAMFPLSDGLDPPVPSIKGRPRGGRLWRPARKGGLLTYSRSIRVGSPNS